MVIPIMVWRFEDAPEEYRNLSEHGGDEDWVVFVPRGQEVPLWANDFIRLVVAEADEYELPAGTVVITAHA